MLRGDPVAIKGVVAAGGGGDSSFRLVPQGEPLQGQPLDDDGVPLVEIAEIHFQSGSVLTVTPRSGVFSW